MPIAKKDLSIGFTMVAREGTYVSNDVVAKNGWEEFVEPGEDIVATGPAEDANEAAPEDHRRRRPGPTAA